MAEEVADLKIVLDLCSCTLEVLVLYLSVLGGTLSSAVLLKLVNDNLEVLLVVVKKRVASQLAFQLQEFVVLLH